MEFALYCFGGVRQTEEVNVKEKKGRHVMQATKKKSGGRPMNHKKSNGLFWSALVLSALVSGQSVIAAETQTPAGQMGHRTVSGVVTKATHDMISLKTSEGTVRNFTFKEARKEGIGGLSVGDKVTLELDEGNQIIDINKEAGISPGGVSGEHRSISGTVVKFDRVKKEVTLKLKDGKTQTYSMKDPAAAKMNNVKNGTPITIYLDEENSLVMDFDRQ
jgi:hypothetical protein